MKKSIVLLLICIVVFLSACQRCKIERINDTVEVPKREEPSDFILPGGNLIAITLGVLLVSSPFFISGYCMGWCGDGGKKTRPVRRRRHGYHLVNHHGHAIHGVVVGPNGLLPFPIIGANELG
jgi:hypothetical protein